MEKSLGGESVEDMVEFLWKNQPKSKDVVGHLDSYHDKEEFLTDRSCAEHFVIFFEEQFKVYFFKSDNPSVQITARCSAETACDICKR